MNEEPQRLLDKYDELILAYVTWQSLPMHSPTAQIALGTYQRLNAEVQQEYNGEYERK